jgi:hypothetical protein
MLTALEGAAKLSVPIVPRVLEAHFRDDTGITEDTAQKKKGKKRKWHDLPTAKQLQIQYRKLDKKDTRIACVAMTRRPCSIRELLAFSSPFYRFWNHHHVCRKAAMRPAEYYFFSLLLRRIRRSDARTWCC